MELVKNNFYPGRVFFNCFEIGGPHIHGYCHYSCQLLFGQRRREILEGLVFSALTNPEHFFGFPVQYYRQIGMYFSNIYPIYQKVIWYAYIFLSIFLLQIMLMDLFHCFPAKLQIFCYLFKLSYIYANQ